MTNEHPANRTDGPAVPATTEADHLTDEDEVAFPTTFYPAADITPVQFEEFVVELLKSMEAVAGIPPVVTLHEKVQGTDGEYDFDATARFDWGGMQFLVLAEAKLHKNPIKRDLVQVLHTKLSSVGAQKAVMFSTAPYQKGALTYAKTHGIALAKVTEGRFTYETRSKVGPPPLTREQARDRWDLPDFVAHAYTAGDEPGTTSVLLMSSRDPECIAKILLDSGLLDGFVNSG